MLNRYEIRADVEGTGPVKHMIRAECPCQAKAKLRRAYSGRKIGSLTVAVRKTDNSQ